MPTTTNVSYHPDTMKSFSTFRLFGKKPEEILALVAELPNTSSPIAQVSDSLEIEESTILKTVGWVSAGLGAVALGLFIGRELRQRYKFNRRTPYDIYSHAGDEQDVDFGLGI
jgi:hypothetical protein